MKEYAEMELMNYCRWGRDYNESSMQILKKFLDLDLTIWDGVFFRLVIQDKNIDLLKTLLDFYREKNLKSDRDTIEYKRASYELCQILEEAIHEFDISPEMQEILNPYIGTEDNSNDQDLSGFDDLEHEVLRTLQPRTPRAVT